VKESRVLNSRKGAQFLPTGKQDDFDPTQPLLGLLLLTGTGVTWGVNFGGRFLSHVLNDSELRLVGKNLTVRISQEY
jgi:hypothetical protein